MQDVENWIAFMQTMSLKNMNSRQHTGIGMTSQRTRDRLVARLEEKGIRNNQVLEAIRITPRHLFVDEALASRAYEDTALPIGHKQTISQPYVVARMTEAIIKDGIPNNVLEVGTGSGLSGERFLAALINNVYSVERVEAFASAGKTTCYGAWHTKYSI